MFSNTGTKSNSLITKVCSYRNTLLPELDISLTVHHELAIY